MKDLGEIEHQLNRLGVKSRFWSRPEIRELRNILASDEVITGASVGRYHGGFCLLVTTDRRLLLIDKKMWFLSMEDVRFDMISEVDYCARLLDSTITVRTFNKVLNFTSVRQKVLRNMTTYLQERVMELRHMNMQQDAQVPVHQGYQQQYYYQALPQAPVQQQTMAEPQTNQPAAQFYATQINPSTRPLRVRRIGAYPTASLTTQHRFFSR